VNEVIGCEDASACNYNSLATDSSICFVPEGCDSCLDTLATQSQIDNSNGLVQSYESQIVVLDNLISDLELQAENTPDTSINSDSLNTLLVALEAELVILNSDLEIWEANLAGATQSYLIVAAQAQVDNISDDINLVQTQIDSANEQLNQSTSSPELEAEIADLNQQIVVIEQQIDSENQNTSMLQAELDAGYIVDNDADNDTYCDSDDAFPTDPLEWTDTDGDGYGDNSDVFQTDSLEWIDTDGDTYGDNGDVFPNDSSEWADTDADTYGDNADVFPNDALEWADTDNDDYGDNGDACPTDSLAFLDTDDDGVCDVWEVVGCQNENACNYMIIATDSGDCIIPVDCESCSGETDGTGIIVDNDSDGDGYCDLGSNISPEEIYGCNHEWADNYNEFTTEEDNTSCYRNGCMYSAMLNYDPLATVDSFLVCNFNQDSLDIEINAVIDSLTAAYEAQVDSLNDAHTIAVNALELEIDSLELQITDLEADTTQLNVDIIDLHAEIDSLDSVISELEDQIDTLIANHVIAIETLEQEHNDAIEQLTSEHQTELTSLQTEIDSLNGVNAANQDSISSLLYQLENYVAVPILIDLTLGWNLIGYTLTEPQDLVASFSEIDDLLQIVKNNTGASYLPEWDFNGIGNLIPGQGYQLKITESVNEFSFPITEMRYELNPSVPQWALDMEIEMHPNDIRTLIRVVNELGQEVNPDYAPIGSVLFYIYNDATVEKHLKN